MRSIGRHATNVMRVNTEKNVLDVLISYEALRDNDCLM